VLLVPRLIDAQDINTVSSISKSRENVALSFSITQDLESNYSAYHIWEASHLENEINISILPLNYGFYHIVYKCLHPHP
jgi:hypothetical protein